MAGFDRRFGACTGEAAAEVRAESPGGELVPEQAVLERRGIELEQVHRFPPGLRRVTVLRVVPDSTVSDGFEPVFCSVRNRLGDDRLLGVMGGSRSIESTLRELETIPVSHE